MELEVQKEVKGPTEIELQVTVPAAAVHDRVETALDELAQKVNLPGFRPGKVPRKVIVQRFGKSVTSEAVSETLQEAYRTALSDSGLEAVSPGEMSDVQYEQGNPLTFKVNVEIMPEFQLPPLEEVSVELLQPTVSDEDVMESLDGLRESHAVLTPTDEPASRDCVVSVDMQELDKSGLPIIGRVRKDLEIDLARVNLGEDFVNRIVGLSAGQNANVELANSAEAKDDEKTRFQVTVNAVRRKELPPLDDEFARTINPQLETVDELKADLARYLEARAMHQARERMFRAVADTLLKKVDFPVPSRMLEGYLDRMAEDARHGHKGHKHDHQHEDGEEIKRFKDEYRASAVWNLRWHIVRKRIISERQLDVTDDDYQKELERLAKLDDKPVGDFKKRLTDEQQDRIKEDLLERKVLAIIQTEVQTIPRQVSLAEFEGRTPGRVVTV